MAEEMITIPKWKFKTIENALRLTHRINNCSTKETAFDREVVKAYDYAKSALEEPASVPQANELLPHVSGSAIDIIKWMADCPYNVDQATVPKNGIEVAPEQVVGNMSLSYVKYKQLRNVAEHYR